MAPVYALISRFFSNPRRCAPRHVRETAYKTFVEHSHRYEWLSYRLSPTDETVMCEWNKAFWKKRKLKRTFLVSYHWNISFIFDGRIFIKDIGDTCFDTLYFIFALDSLCIHFLSSHSLNYLKKIVQKGILNICNSRKMLCAAIYLHLHAPF